ncbi:hypothetical protein PVAP13_9KG272013 [Panicum virgatum]|uniref:Uncharacterized protein n=1 Tax=Panicum virgatum TaxID=38727 RepID=A0A8T0NRP4_PANVG|nr:hypothetical protein PVAP13_9KG272013 [Panicum virgatum]
MAWRAGHGSVFIRTMDWVALCSIEVWKLVQAASRIAHPYHVGRQIEVDVWRYGSAEDKATLA